MSQRSPFIFGYSMILPAVWLTVGVTGSLILPGRRLGIVGTALMFLGATALISWLFARRHRRQFSTSEYWRIIAYCFLWAVALEFFGLFTVIVLPRLKEGHVEAKPLLFAMTFTMVVDAALIWLAFRQPSRRVIAWYLRKPEANVSSKSESA